MTYHELSYFGVICVFIEMSFKRARRSYFYICQLSLTASLHKVAIFEINPLSCHTKRKVVPLLSNAFGSDLKQIRWCEKRKYIAVCYLICILLRLISLLV